MDARKTLIAWTPGTEYIRVGPLIGPDEDDWSEAYSRTGGAAYAWTRTAPDDDLKSALNADFIAVVFRDGVCPFAAYREFMKIRQFRDAVPVDMPGMPTMFSAGKS